jgi:RNA polymerase sigma-70 factor (ECF subfamily)
MPRKRVAEAAGELDELTLRRAQRGDEAACRVLVELYQRRVFALLSRVLAGAGRGALCEDLAQETFLRVFRALPAFDRGGPARLSTWILTVATRLALDELRRHAPRLVPVEALEEMAGEARTDETVLRRGAADAVTRAVAGLPPEFRASFLLRELHGLSYDEIAEATGADLGTVKSRLHRARAALRQALMEIRDA